MITQRYNERDRQLVRAINLQLAGKKESAEKAFRRLVKYHSEPDGRYGSGNDLFLYEPNADAFRYAEIIARFAGLEDGLVKELHTKFLQSRRDEGLRSRSGTRLRHVNPRNGKVVNLDLPYWADNV